MESNLPDIEYNLFYKIKVYQLYYDQRKSKYHLSVCLENNNNENMLTSFNKNGFSLRCLRPTRLLLMLLLVSMLTDDQ